MRRGVFPLVSALSIDGLQKMHANLYGNLRVPQVDLLVIVFIFEVAKIDSKSDINYYFLMIIY